MDPRGFFLPLAEGERISGRWKARYRPPGGGSFPGELQVSDRRVFFVAQVESAQLQPLTMKLVLVGERFVRSPRRECLDHVLVIGVLQLIRILKEYVTYFNQARPHTCTPRPADPA